MGKFGFGVRYDTGETIVQYVHYQNIFIVNIFFTKTQKRKRAWEATNATTGNDIDFIITK